eukprot:m.308962 g.308962  ORF g.308962 m.308962 type:complete len:386 (+) comp45176_c0_seq1:21-1178(+)
MASSLSFDGEVLREGWATKESGEAFMGHYNWRRRWFKLVQSGSSITLSYYKKKDDRVPAGSVCLDKTYCTRELEAGEKSKPNCFAVGPLIDNGAIRTYFISCESDDDKLDWMTIIQAAIEGVPERAEKRRKTIAFKQKQRGSGKIRPLFGTVMEEGVAEEKYHNPQWRIEQWMRLCKMIHTGEWKRTDTKNGVTISRFSFKEQDIVILKVEGIMKAPPDVIFTFLQRATRSGGKIDYVFRNETVIEEIESDPPGAIFHREYPVPLPRISPRYLCALRTWMPAYCTPDGTSGLMVISLRHPREPTPSKGAECVEVAPSGIVLLPGPTEAGEGESTRLVIVAQIDVQRTLQRMLRGAYKSGLLKIGLRSGFQHLSQHIDRQMELFNI